MLAMGQIVGLSGFIRVTKLREGKTLKSKPEVSSLRDLWHIDVPFFSYPVLQEVWLVLHKSSPL